MLQRHILRHLVAPPHPVSHIRPVLYQAPPEQPPLPHPYSLQEFTPTPTAQHDLHFHLLRQQLDTLHHTFWLDSNTRFYSAQQSILNALPTDASVRDKEIALSTFFNQWVMQEQERVAPYAAEWRRRNFQLIVLEARVEYQRFKKRVSSFFN